MPHKSFIYFMNLDLKRVTVEIKMCSVRSFTVCFTKSLPRLIYFDLGTVCAGFVKLIHFTFGVDRSAPTISRMLSCCVYFFHV
jgi:hypothetical protein